MQIKLRTTQYARLTLAPVDADGKPAQLDGKPVVTVVEGDAKVRVIGDDILIIPSDTPGTSKLKITGDGDEGPDVSVIEEEIELVALHPTATGLGLGFVVGQKADLPPEEFAPAADAPAATDGATTGSPGQ